ncbi:RNA-processing protein [Metallosphaera tengchongensis]|uniref:RNA-processing protein n=1 Tax=Metallosphaera tengchongensis TaxID=1532350 RepID=A0A6N0NYQ9_9CREN|nr:KH domain-containing protein [Metallosphaera tengchongensis]QKR00508.1 RNA-processing protein [Metallosphaera tengchongensis]
MFISVPDEKLEFVKGLIPKLTEMGGVEIEYSQDLKYFIVDPKNQNPYQALKVVSVIKALGYGVPISEALKLLGEDYMMDVIDLKESIENKYSIRRIKGRIIGEDGKTKRIIQEYTGVTLVVSDRSVALLGPYEQIPIARKALELLLKGKEHSSVYRYLDRAEEQLLRYRGSSRRRPTE